MHVCFPSGLPPPITLPELPTALPISQVQSLLPLGDEDEDDMDGYYEVPHIVSKQEAEQQEDTTPHPLPPLPVPEQEDDRMMRPLPPPPMSRQEQDRMARPLPLPPRSKQDDEDRMLRPLPPLPEEEGRANRPLPPLPSSDIEDDNEQNIYLASNVSPISRRPPCPLPPEVTISEPPPPLPPAYTEGDHFTDSSEEESDMVYSTMCDANTVIANGMLAPLPSDGSLTEDTNSGPRERCSTMPSSVSRREPEVPIPRPRLFSRPQEKAPKERPKATRRSVSPILSLQPTQSRPSEKGDSDTDDPYLQFQMDLESMDISKLTLEQLEQIDPRQAQLWMLLKMHQMVKKVEDVYESAEQLYSVYQEPPTLPARSSVPPAGNQPRKYENTAIKCPVPKPRIRGSNAEKDHEATPISLKDTSPGDHNISEPAGRQEGKSSQDTHTGAVKLYRRQKVIGEL